MSQREILRLASLLLLFFSLCNVAKAADKPQQSYANKSLDTFSIFRPKDNIETAKDVPVRVRLGETVEQSHGAKGYEHLYMITKPHDQRVVAVLAVLHGGRPILNPRYLEFEYGPIPDLNKISLETADKLWRSKSTRTDSKPDQGEIEKVYSLQSKSMNGGFIPTKTFELGAVFANNQLKKYRVRSEAVNDRWHDVSEQ
jgi:hypothetical protein